MDMEAKVEWDDLPGDLLASIGELLSVSARIRCRGVCRSWRAGIRPEAEAMPSPWVVMTRQEGCSDSFTFLSIPTMKFIQWTPPGGERMRCVGSNAGWLAVAVVTLVDRVVRISLVNPLTDARVDIPNRMYRLASDMDPELEEIVMDFVVRKVAFAPTPSAHDYTIAAVIDLGYKVAYGRGRPGVSDPWLGIADLPRFRGGEGVAFQLDVAYHDGKFYYMALCGQVWVVDMAVPSPSPAPFANLVPPVVPRLIHRRRGFYLAFSDDGTLHVLWTRSDHDGSTWNDPDMLVLRYDPSSSKSESAWEKPKPDDGLGGAAFLIGDRNQTLFVRDRDGVGSCLCPDSVYFTNSALCRHLGHRPYCYRDHGVWVFDVATDQIDWQVTSYDDDEPAPALAKSDYWLQSLWFTPRAQ